MTRTERATNPRALIRDRSNSKSGMDKSMRKSGGGAHNWGNTMDQIEGEMYDEGDEATLADLQKSASTSPANPSVLVDQPKDRRASVSTASTGMADDEKEKAIEYRSKALKDGTLDLAAIARTSGALSTSPK